MMNAAVRPFVRRKSFSLGILGSALLALPGCGPQDPVEEPDSRAEHTGHQTEVHLDAAQLEAAGIETTTAAAGTIEETLHLVARVASNENTVVHVTPRTEGIIRAVYKGLGDRVQVGDPLAEIWSLELGNTINSYLQAHASTLAAAETRAKFAELYRRRLDTVTEVLDGEIAVARAIYEREEQLQEKGIATIRPYLEANKALQRAVLAKERELTMLAAEREARLLELDISLRQARIEENAARERLRVLGFDDAEITALAGGKHQHGRMVLRAPRAGVILARHATLNEHVGTEQTLFAIHDLSTIWILASAYEKDLPRLRPGQKAYVRLNALPQASITGEVSLIDYQVSPTTRSASVRIELPNDAVEGWPVEFPLRPGMFGEVEIVVDSRVGRIIIPEAAIVHEGEESFVFVAEEGEAGVFRRQAVTVRPGARDLVEIVTGVEPGQPLVVKGTFILKSMARSAELGEGHSH